MITDGNYIYRWTKNNEQDFEKLSIIYKTDDYRMEVSNFVFNIYSKERIIMMDNGSGTWIRLPFEHYNNNYDIDNKRLVDGSYYSLVDTLNKKYNEGELPSYITRKVIKKIGLVFRTPMNRLIKSTDKRNAYYEKKKFKKISLLLGSER